MSRRDEVLVSTAWVEEHLDDPHVRVVEVDRDASLHRLAHVPGSLFWSARDDLRAPRVRDVASAGAVRDLLSRSGVAPGTLLVLHSDEGNRIAAWAAWVLHLRGWHDVRLMDGGRRLWEAEGRPVAGVPTPHVRGAMTVLGPARPDVRCGRDEVLARAADGTSLILDVRSPAEYHGDMLGPPHLPAEQALVPGHVPGAVNVPWAGAVAPDGRIRTDEQLVALYAAAGVTGDREVITYCRVGEGSAHTWLVLDRILGFPGVRNYDGSWTEYGNLVGAPVER